DQGELEWELSLSIDTTTQQAQPRRYVYHENGPRAATDLNFRGNSRDWSFIQFESLPANVELKVKGNPEGYQVSEPIVAQRYYPFKTRLPLTMEIKPQGAPMPVELKFWIGTGNAAQDQAQLKNPALRVGDVRKLHEEGLQVREVGDKQSLVFLWDQPAAGNTAQSTAQTSAVTLPDPQVSPSPDSTPGPSWYSYLTVDYPVLGTVLLLLALAGVVIFLLVILPWIISFIRDMGWFRRGSGGLRQERPKKTTTSIRPEAGGGDMYESLGGSNTQAGQETLATAETTGKKDYSSFRSKVQTFQMDASGKKQEAQEQRVQAQPKPLLRGDELREPNPMQLQQTGAAPAGGQDGRKLFEFEDRIKQLEEGLGQKVGWKDKLSETARKDVEDMLSLLEGSILQEVERIVAQRLKDATGPLDELFESHTNEVDDKIKEIREQVEQAKAGAAGAGGQFGELAKELGRAEGRFRERLDGLRAVAERQVVLDSLYASRLGAVLGENVEALRDGNFNQQVVERLNQFFETGVGRGEGLQELRDRVERINAALKEVLERMGAEGRNPEAAKEAQNHAARFSSLVGELASLQAQLATRRATVETTLRVPVSLHAGARQTFLDELGRGIRREVDKLSQPEIYFEGELERLITADLIAVVDNCDKKIGLPPASPAGLEGALGRLFEAAGLRPILPRQGEPFKAAEQDLVEMVRGSGQSLTVERVVTRGFYYGQGESKTLLRKAGVMVCR
ncbi:MAG: hypothetical protein M3348_06845, partial [Acidobacteriota bacterium]|nr:hypothetical protein [Acidobacteriota bacterium]